MKSSSVKQKRQYRHKRVRRKICGTADRPRMAITLSGRVIYVQFIDDVAGVTLGQVSTSKKNMPNNIASARAMGEAAAEIAKEKGIADVVFDRAGHKFHGRVKAVVQAFRGDKIEEPKKESKKASSKDDDKPAAKKKSSKKGDGEAKPKTEGKEKKVAKKGDSDAEPKAESKKSKAAEKQEESE
jgi:large subunit ribosomal protein L18